MEQAKFIIQSTIEKQDYRKFLYYATFLRNKTILPMISLLALAGSAFLAFSKDPFSPMELVVGWIFLFVLAIGVVIYRVERQNKSRISTDKTGTFGTWKRYKFYEDKIIIENDALKGSVEFSYDKIHQLLDTKEYFIFYITANEATLIRKADLKSAEEVAALKEFLFGRIKK